MPLKHTSYARLAARVGAAGVTAGIGQDQDFQTVSATAYFEYFGCWPWARPINFVRAVYTIAGSGAQTAEVGLFSSTAPPNKSGLSFTKLISTATVDDLTAVPATSGTKRGNTSSFAYLVPANTYLYGGIRISMATTQPKFFSLFGDRGLGYVQTTASAAALTGAGPWAGSIPALAAWLNSGAQGPALYWSLD